MENSSNDVEVVIENEEQQPSGCMKGLNKFSTGFHRFYLAIILIPIFLNLMDGIEKSNSDEALIKYEKSVKEFSEFYSFGISQMKLDFALESKESMALNMIFKYAKKVCDESKKIKRNVKNYDEISENRVDNLNFHFNSSLTNYFS